MTSLLLHGGTLYTPRDRLDDAWLLVRNGTIAAIGQGAPPDDGGVTPIDCRGATVAPGLIDIHTHGAGGADVMDATPDAIHAIARAHAAGGTTSWFGTTVAAPLDETLAVVQAAAPLVGEPLAGATLIGLHLEGPYLAPAQCGAHRPEHLRLPAAAEYARLLGAAGGVGAGRITAAPELPGGLALGEAARARGLHAAIGHSDADLATVRRALDAGYSHVTHLYSCTSGLRIEGGYKTPGINEAALLFDDLTVELIADGHHVPAALLELVHKIKGPDRVCLVTDSMRAAGLGPGKYALGGWEVLVEDGVAKLPDRSKFAGSVCTMAQAVRTATAAGIPLRDALQMASETPARLVGLSTRGTLAPGRGADIVVLDKRLDVRLTVAGGRIVHATDEVPALGSGHG